MEWEGFSVKWEALVSNGRSYYQVLSGRGYQVGGQNENRAVKLRCRGAGVCGGGDICQRLMVFCAA